MMTNILNLKNCKKVFGQNTIINGINLNVNKGDKIALIGESGSGKTTLLNILGLLDEQTEGDYFLYGKKINELTDKVLSQIRGDVFSFIFQSYHLIDKLTVTENITLSNIYTNKDVNRNKLNEWLEVLGISHIENRLIENLSGGEKQRVAIGRALYSEPKIILCDEPTGNLDSENSLKVINQLLKLSADITIIIVTHDISVANKFEKIFRIKGGQLYEEKKLDS